MKNYIKHIFKKHLSAVLSIGFLIVFATTFHMLADAPVGGYDPGETLNPDCLPGADDCVVTIPSDYWSLTGDAGTVDGTNFIGTTDEATAVPLNFKVDGQKAGRIGVAADGSVFLGYQAGNVDDLSANNNTFIGYQAGNANTTGNGNTIIGSLAGYSSINTRENVVVGGSALYTSTAGRYNTVVGYQALHFNTESTNTVIGNNAGYSNSTGSGNVFLGNNAGYDETGSNKLYIANSNTTTPLIYGEFDNNLLRINGNVNLDLGTYDMKFGTQGSVASGSIYFYTNKYPLAYARYSIDGIELNPYGPYVTAILNNSSLSLIDETTGLQGIGLNSLLGLTMGSMGLGYTPDISIIETGGAETFKVTGATGGVKIAGSGAPATGGALCLNASNQLNKCTSAVNASGNCTCP